MLACLCGASGESLLFFHESVVDRIQGLRLLSTTVWFQSLTLAAFHHINHY